MESLYQFQQYSFGVAKLNVDSFDLQEVISSIQAMNPIVHALLIETKSGNKTIFWSNDPVLLTKIQQTLDGKVELKFVFNHQLCYSANLQTVLQHLAIN
ncbi:hypothetical protein [Leptolyngbya sp. AN10]|uniref:hypothetical protein n=1 Tax=Leptolyngbya sp. AN10 TaxID=3423365 RepID=UPI003D31D11A